MTHICVGNLTIIGSDNGLSPGRRQAIIWTNIGILLIGPVGRNFNEILIEIDTFSFTKMHLKMSSAQWRPFYLGLNCTTCQEWTCFLPFSCFAVVWYCLISFLSFSVTSIAPGQNSDGNKASEIAMRNKNKYIIWISKKQYKHHKTNHKQTVHMFCRTCYYSDVSQAS